MPGHLPIGIAAGLIAAVALVSASTGPLLARALLFVLTPLPLFLAGLGWGWATALIGAIAGAIALALVASPATGAVFAFSHAAPVVVLSYLALLNRPAQDNGPDVDPVTGTEWYPLGRIVVWTAGLSGVLALAAMLMLAPDIDALRALVRKLIDEVVKTQIESISPGKTLSETELTQLTDAGVYLLPAMTALWWMMTLLINLWLAARITHASGHLARPWPDIAAMRFPRGTPMVLAVSTAATLLPGYAALGASAISGAFYAAYVMMGLAVIHYVTRGQTWRPIALWGLYLALFIINAGVSMVVAILGLADSFISIRKGPQHPPPGSGPSGPGS